MSDLPTYEVQGWVDGERVLLAEFEVNDFEHQDPMRAFAERATIPIEIVEKYE